MPQPCTALRVAPWAGSHRSFRHRHTLRRLPWGIGRPGPRAEALRLCRLRSLAVATPESSAPTSGIATRPLRSHACSSRCRTTPPKLVVITPLPMAGGAAGTLPYAYAYASVSLCRCHALSAAQAVHSCHISGREVFSSVNFTSLSIRRCWRIIRSRQPIATPTPVPSARVSVPQSASIAARNRLHRRELPQVRHATWRCEPITHIPTPLR